MNYQKFQDFLFIYNISTRKFAENVISKSTVASLTKPNGGGLSASFIAEILPTAIEATANWLRRFGKSEAEINQTIFDIFEKEYFPMIINRQKLDEEVLDFFNLERDPFALESDPRSADEVFTCRELERVTKRIEDAVNFEGFLAVLAPIGAGKTALKNRVAASLKKKGNVHFIFPKFAEMGKLNSGSIIHYLLEYFGQKARHRLVMAQSQLEKHLEYLNGQGVKVTICFDECHRLNDATLTALKNFYELGTGGYERYLGMILFGQPTFKTRLEDVQFREIAERLEVVELPSLSKVAAEYIAHRLYLVGADINQLFEARAIAEIAKQATTPLAIGNLANKALIKAYKKGEKFVTIRYVEQPNEPKTRKLAAVR